MNPQIANSPLPHTPPFARAADHHASRVVALLPELRTYALQLARNRSDADDLVQDTVERALAKRHQFTEGTSLRGWVFTILRNRFLSECRDRRRWGDSEEFASAIATASAPSSQEQSVEVSTVGRAFERLPRRDQLVIELVGIRGLNYGEVASILKVPTGTVRSRLSRARRRLSELSESGLGPVAA